MGDCIPYNLFSSHLTPTGRYMALSYKVQNTSKIYYFCQEAKQTEENRSLIYISRRQFQITQKDMFLKIRNLNYYASDQTHTKLNRFSFNKRDIYHGKL